MPLPLTILSSLRDRTDKREDYYHHHQLWEICTRGGVELIGGRLCISHFFTCMPLPPRKFVHYTCRKGGGEIEVERLSKTRMW